jgi:hypothetical protein
MDPRKLLAVYYGLRGLALLAVPALLGPEVAPPLLVVVALFGLDWVATVPPTVVLCREAFGAERGGIIFGWVFAAHMIGASAAAAVSGAMRAASGDYTSAWLLAGALAVVAAAASLTLPRSTAPAEQPRRRSRSGRSADGRLSPQAAPASSAGDRTREGHAPAQRQAHPLTPLTAVLDGHRRWWGTGA